MGFFDFLSPDSTYQKQLQEKDDLILALTAELKEKNATIEQIDAEKDALVQALNNKINEKKSIIQRISTEKSELENTLKNEIAQLNHEISSLNSLKTDIDNYKRQIEIMKTKIVNLEIENRSLSDRTQEQLKACQERSREIISDLCLKNTKLENENANYFFEMEELRRQYGPLIAKSKNEKEIQVRVDFLIKCTLQMKFYHILHCYCLQKILENKKAFCRQEYNAAVQQCNQEIHEYEKTTSLEEYKQLRGFISEWEFFHMSQPARNQLALDRYNKRRKNEFDIGLEYERYIGYLYEMQNYEVRYHGAINKFKDKGIDLYAISKKKKEVIVIQCKRWGKSSIVRENVLLELSGSAKFAQTKFPKKQIRPVLYTTTSVSKDALAIAEKLGIEVFENFDIQEYPLIKCNISETGEKIYHLPNFQRYDTIFITPSKGDFYTATVEEATSFGFRPAHKWKGKNDKA